MCENQQLKAIEEAHRIASTSKKLKRNTCQNVRKLSSTTKHSAKRISETSRKFIRSASIHVNVRSSKLLGDGSQTAKPYKPKSKILLVRKIIKLSILTIKPIRSG